jgi:phosphoribosylglycinamide formyltransferase-1
MTDISTSHGERMKRRVAILISGRGSNMAALIEGARTPDFPAEIVLVLSNKPDAAGLAHAAGAGIPTHVIDSKPFGNDRAAFETAMQAVLDAHKVDLICLGGFMRLLTDDFVNRWSGRMLNIHPSLLPSFRGLDPHGQALRAGVKVSGATVHFVTPEMDAGPIVMQGVVAVCDDDTADTLAARVLKIEHRIYPAALKLVASGAVRIDGDVCRITSTTGGEDTLVAPL